VRFVIGTSGWQYDDWRGDLYPADLARTRWLEHYAARFPTVEVNNTFYRLPDRHVFEDWRCRVPKGFCFALKMSRYLSHIRRLQAPAEPVQRFVTRAGALQGHWGPTLLQLPPTLAVDPARLRRLLDRWPPERRLAIELRHESWFTGEVRDLLTEHQVALVLADRRGRPLQPWWPTAPWTYVRFHQGTHRHPGYRAPTLRRWIDELRSAWDDSGEAYVYFNNDSGGAAWRDALHFAELSGTPMPGPPAR
jgi:uncharacterized protein YecE (DUF72 family)